MTHEHDIKNSAHSFLINPSDRGIYKTSPGNITLMQGDHNSVTFSFRMPRYIGGHDMSLCNKIELNYTNVSLDKVNKTEDVHIVKDMVIDTTDENYVLFSWTLTKNATKYAGALSFLIEFACVKEDATVDYSWHTNKHTLTMTEGMDNTEAVIEVVSDVLAAWEAEVIKKASEIYTKEIEEFKKAVNEDIKTFKTDLTEGNITVKEATNANSATNDGEGNNIVETYETKEDADKTKEEVSKKVNKNGDALNGVFYLGENKKTMFIAADAVAMLADEQSKAHIGFRNGKNVFAPFFNEQGMLSLHGGIISEQLPFPFMFFGLSKDIMDDESIMQLVEGNDPDIQGILMGSFDVTYLISFYDRYIPFLMSRRLMEWGLSETSPETITMSGDGVIVGDGFNITEDLDNMWQSDCHRTVYSNGKIMQWHRTVEPYEDNRYTLNIPDKNGTLALVEDIDSAIGDISSALDELHAYAQNLASGVSGE